MAVAVDATGTAQGTTTSTKVTSFNYTGITVGASATALVFVVTIGDDVSAAPTNISVVWDSGGTNQTMTLLTSKADPSAGANGNQVFIYGLRNPTAGNKTLAVSWTTSLWFAGNAISFTGSETSSDAAAFPHTNTATGAGTTSLSISITSAVGNWTVGGYVSLNGTGTTNHTLWFDSSTAGLFTNDNVLSQQATGAATVTFTDTWTGNAGWGAAAIDIAASGATPAAAAVSSATLMMMGVGP